MKNLKTQFAVLLLSTVCLLTGAYGQITPSADSYTNTATTTTNYGAKPLLDVDAATQTTYIQFNLASIPATYNSADITKATLKLYVNSVLTAGSFNVDYVNGTWAENTITSSLAPALGTTIAASVPVITADKNQFLLIDVTAAVQAWLSGTANDGIALVANGTFNATFDSKESTSTSHAPELDIVFAGGGTLTGITTASGSGLTGGGTSGTLNLSLSNVCTANQVLQYNGSSWVCAAVGAGTVTSVGSGAGLTGGPIIGSGTLSIAPGGVTNAMLATAYAQLGAANTFTGVQTIDSGINITSGSLSATLGVAGGNAIIGTETAITGTSIGLLGNSSSTSGYGVYGTSPNIGVYGTGLFGVRGVSSNIGVWGTGSIGVNGTSSSTAGGGGVVGNATATTGNAPGVVGVTNSSAGYGVQGSDLAISGGTAGSFQVSTASATILQGSNNGTTEFAVDAAGDVIAAGAVSAGGSVSGSSFQIAGQLFGYGNNNRENAFLGFAGSPTTNATAVYDTAVGDTALSGDTNGENTAVGYGALGTNTTGTTNTAIGIEAGTANDGSNLTGGNNTALGAFARLSIGSLSNATVVGAGAMVSESNALVLGNGANVGIGTSAPTAALDVVGNSLQALIGDPGCGSGFAGVGFVNHGGFNSCTNYALLGDTPGNLYVNSSLSGSIYFRNNNGTLMTIDTSGDVHIKGVASATGGFSGQCLTSGAFDSNTGAACNMDLAEAYTSAQATEAGDLVSLVPTSEATVHKSSKRYEALLLGVVSTNPGLVFDNGKTHLAGDNSVAASKDKAVIALAGRVPVKVSMENGPVSVGDPLTSSSHPGLAMKATAAGKIIGYALAPATENGKVLMFVQPGYYAAPQLAQLHRENLQLQRENKGLRDQFADVLMQVKQQQSLLRAQSAAMRSLAAEVRETRETLQKVKAQVVAAQPALVAAK